MPQTVKPRKSQINSRVHALPTLRFEEQQLTSYGGTVVLQALFARLSLKKSLSRCFAPVKGAVYGTHIIATILIVHLMLGCRQLRERDVYANDPLIKRLLGLSEIPDVATMTRRLGKLEKEELAKVHAFNRKLVIERLKNEDFELVTVDFDGSVISTRRHAEGTAVGFNKKRKGQRSYYPLLATVAQSGQILDLLHRSGNVHDSNGADEFMRACFDEIRTSLPNARLESRMDSAFFSEKIVRSLAEQGVEFSVSLPFERFPKLKTLIAKCENWKRIDKTWRYAELDWKPKKWREGFRVIAIRQKVKGQRKGPLQLDLFEPIEYEHRYKVILTNKVDEAANLVLHFHNGRGSQEGIIGEAKSCTQLDYIPMRHEVGNRMFTLASVMAHNLGRELQIVATERFGTESIKRVALWPFRKLSTLRRYFFQRAGRLNHPEGKLTLTVSGDERVHDELTHLLDAQLAA